MAQNPETWEIVSRELDSSGNCLCDEHGYIIEIRESLLPKDVAISRFMELISDIRAQHPDCTIRAYVEEQEERTEDGDEYFVPEKVFTTNNDIQDNLATIRFLEKLTVCVISENEEAPVKVYEMFFGVDDLDY